MRTAAVALAALLLAQPAAAQDDARRAAESVARFGVDLYRVAGREPGNVFVSPYSIWTALAMTREGALGDTAAELDAALRSPADLTRSQGHLARALAPRRVTEHTPDGPRERLTHELSVANALWGQDGYAFEAPFLERLEGAYGAPLQRIDFRQGDAARRRINDWVARRTRDRIRDIVPQGQPTPDTRLALANALHFKASWERPFREGATRDAPFHVAGRAPVTAPFMKLGGHFAYAEDGAVQVLELAYRGDETSMVIVLPRQRDGLPAVEGQLSWERLAAWLEALRRTRVDVELPRFSFRRPLDLKAALSELGVARAFDPDRAEFGGMTRSERLFVGAALHQAFVAVDERGTEAAAATVVMMAATGVPRPVTPVAFVADHPFLFLIRHRPTGCVLFVGRVADPT